MSWEPGQSKYTPGRVEAYLAALREGATLKQAAARIDTYYGTVEEWRGKHKDFDARVREHVKAWSGVSAQAIQAATASLVNGVSPEDAARTAGFSPSTLYYRAQRDSDVRAALDAYRARQREEKARRVESEAQHRAALRAAREAERAAAERHVEPPRAAPLTMQQVRCRLRSKYGLDIADAVRMLEAQGGKCPVCERCISLDGKDSEQAVVDHCHDTLVIRGLMCSQCNAAVGMLGDNTESLARAVMYLSTHSTGLRITPEKGDLLARRELRARNRKRRRAAKRRSTRKAAGAQLALVARTRRPYTCGKCGRQGHNRQSCAWAFDAEAKVATG